MDCVLCTDICDAGSWSDGCGNESLGRGSQSTLSDSKIASGLKEALQVGAGNACETYGPPRWLFWGRTQQDPAARKIFARIEKEHQAVGYGPKVDEFVLRGTTAGSAAPAARKIFGDAILWIASFDDARKTFRRRHSSDRLLQEQDDGSA